jgi:hypothetical protein
MSLISHKYNNLKIDSLNLILLSYLYSISSILCLIIGSIISFYGSLSFLQIIERHYENLYLNNPCL